MKVLQRNVLKTVFKSHAILLSIPNNNPTLIALASRLLDRIKVSSNANKQL